MATISEYDGIARKAGLALTSCDLEEMKKTLDVYEFQRVIERRNFAGERKELDKLIDSIEQATQGLERQYRKVIKSQSFLKATGVLPSQALETFSLVGDYFIEYRKVTSKPGRRADEWMDALLLYLEKIFIKGGGGTTGIARGASQRGGKFIKFVWAILLTFTPGIRPSEQSIAARWERISQARNR